MSQTELFDVVDEAGWVVGQAPRSQCHQDPSLIHQAVHVLVFDCCRRLFLQKRSALKDTQPGKWDTSVGGHLAVGEAPETGAWREMQEELGVTPQDLTLAYQYLWHAPYETELIRTYYTLHNGPFLLQKEEIDEGRFWALDEIQVFLGKGIFTPQFESEFPRMKEVSEILQ